MGLRLLTGCVWLVVTANLASQANAQGPHLTNRDSTMPFELVSDFVVVVEGQLGELHGLRFILDTGSSHTVIDRQIVDRLGLQRHPQGEVMNFNRYIPVEWAEVPNLRFGPIRATALRVLVVNLAEQSEFAQGADGILGLDLLSRARKLAIDYEKRLVHLEVYPDGKEATPASNGFVVPVVVQGLPMRWLVDTGFRDILVYKESLRTGLSHLRTEGRPKKVAMGPLKATQVNLPGIQIFGRDAVTQVFLIDKPKPNSGAVDGYLGPAALHAKRLELDFAAMVLRWQ
jgi:predicted aspartyl protease